METNITLVLEISIFSLLVRYPFLRITQAEVILDHLRKNPDILLELFDQWIEEVIKTLKTIH